MKSLKVFYLESSQLTCAYTGLVIVKLMYCTIHNVQVIYCTSDLSIVLYCTIGWAGRSDAHCFNSIAPFLAVQTGPEKWGLIHFTSIPSLHWLRRVSLHFGGILDVKHRFKPDKTIQSPYCGEARKHPNKVKFEREIRKAFENGDNSEQHELTWFCWW